MGVDSDPFRVKSARQRKKAVYTTYVGGRGVENLEGINYHHWRSQDQQNEKRNAEVLKKP